MTPAEIELDLTENTPASEQFGSLTRGENPPLYGSGGRDRIGAIQAHLGNVLPGVEIAQFVYRRQTQDNLLQTGAYGANMVSDAAARCILKTIPSESKRLTSADSV